MDLKGYMELGRTKERTTLAPTGGTTVKSISDPILSSISPGGSPLHGMYIGEGI